MKGLVAILMLLVAAPVAAQTPTCTSSKTTRLVAKGNQWVAGTLKSWYVSSDSVAQTCKGFPSGSVRVDTVRVTDTVTKTVTVVRVDTVYIGQPPVEPPTKDTVAAPPPISTGAVWSDDFRYSNTAALIASSKYAGSGDTRSPGNIALITGQVSYDGTVRPFARYSGSAGQFTRKANGPVDKGNIWIEFSARISTNFPSGCQQFQEVKWMLVFWPPTRFNLELFNQCARSVLGYPGNGNTEATWVRNHPFTLNDGKWHIWRFHFRGTPCLAAFMIDGKLIESETCPSVGGAATEYQWGLPYINSPSSGYVDYGHRAIYTSDPGWGL